MPKKPEKELATVAVKLNFTPTEFALIDSMREADDERSAGVWIRKAALRAARDRQNAQSHPALHMGRPVDAAENPRRREKGGKK